MSTPFQRQVAPPVFRPLALVVAFAGGALLVADRPPLATGQLISDPAISPPAISPPAIGDSVISDLANVEAPLPATPPDMPTFRIGARTFQVAPGLKMTRAAGPPLVERPICITADERGRLYVAESSGSNDPVVQQLKDKPHKILRLVDRDDDGVFDERTEFVSGIMFPEGAQWHDGSLYVAAPPQIWKLTDDDDDGVADRQEVWFDGHTLTGCANDLHGPYLGPDGWLYWCKGAWAQQTHQLTDGTTLDSHAAHVFRRHPQGGPLEPVMSGGMDNPVEVAFTRGGERILTTTFLQRPEEGRRDGLIHIVYGGLYGKDHDVLQDRVRTGPLMPILEHLGAAAPAGLLRLETNGLGDALRDALLVCSFNLRQVSAHLLTPRDATFATQSRPVVTSADLDFHPTDVLEDVDGSVLIVDTGGWYKLCCPSSQLWKPDELGAIYRIVAADAPQDNLRQTDPRGKAIEWDSLTPNQCVALLSDPRPAVWRAAQRRLLLFGDDAVEALTRGLAARPAKDWSERLVWTLCQIDGVEARSGVRDALSHTSPIVRSAAIHATSLWRDRLALPGLLEILADDTPTLGRAAAEALGRLKIPDAIEPLISKLDRLEPRERVFQHSLTYALWETGDADLLRAQWRRDDLTSAQRSGLLWALEQQPHVKPMSWEQVAPCLAIDDAQLAPATWWAVDRHDEWTEPLLATLSQAWGRGDAESVAWRPATEWLVRRIGDPRVNAWLRERLQTRGVDSATRERSAVVVQQLAAAGGSPAVLAENWDRVWLGLLDEEVERQTPHGVKSPPMWSLAALLASQRDKAHLSSKVRQRMCVLAADLRLSTDQRLQAVRLSVDPAGGEGGVPGGGLDEQDFQWVLTQLVPEASPARRALAVDICQQTSMTDSQFRAFAQSLVGAVPIELSRMVELALQQAQGSGRRQLLLLESLSQNDAATSLDPAPLEKALESDLTEVQSAWRALRAAIVAAQSDRQRQLEDRFARLPTGQVSQGQQVFHSPQAACFSCHSIGYRGGSVGPDLTNIGRIRSPRDLLEAILFPSASFVRSYEPVTVVTHDGRALSGLLESGAADEVVLRSNATQVHRLPNDDVAEIRLGGPSLMPAGMGELLTDQQLADLLAFLASQ